MKQGSVEKRGFGPRLLKILYIMYFSLLGGVRNTAYKKRWFILTEEGAVLYFKASDSTAPLGSFSIEKVSFIID